MSHVTIHDNASTKSRRAGTFISALPVLFLIWDGIGKLLQLAPVLEGFAELGYPATVAIGIGLVELVCVAIYLIPRTSILGAILLTGYLGGAIATHVRVGDPLFSHVLFPTYVATLLWVGLWLRDVRLRTLVSPRGASPQRIGSRFGAVA